MARSKIIAAMAVAAVAIVHPVGDAVAACHAFTVTADPATVAEGGGVTVTVARDAAIGQSQVDVETVDAGATGSSDYEPVARRTIEFTSETEQSFPLATIDDGEAEGPETFRLHLSNPAGCTVNPNFVVGPDAEVTITDNDSAATPAAPPAPTTTGGGTSRTSATASPATTTSTTTDPAAGSSTTASTTTTSEVETDDVALPSSPDGDDDDSAVPAVIAVVLVAVAVAAVGAWWRRRSRPV